MFLLPWTKKKKRTIPEIRGEKNIVPSCDIMLNHERSARGKVICDYPRLCPALIEHITEWNSFFSPRILGMVLFFVQGSSDDSSSIVHSLTTYIHPLAVGDFVRTRRDLLTERPKVTNEVEVAASEADVVHVSETNQRHELRTDAGLFENFSWR